MSSSHTPHASSDAQPKVPSNPLSLFFLPPDLVSTLVPMAQTESDSLLKNTTTTTTTDTARSALETTVPVATSLDTAVPSCRVCGITRFESVLKQREHAKLDWHRYNLKQHLLDRNANPITEHDFENMVQDLSSISGSDDDDLDHDDSDHEHKSGHTTPNSRSKKSITAATASKEDGQEALIQSLMKNLELTIKENQRTRNQDPVLIHQQQILEQQLQEAKLSPMIWFTTPVYGETVRLGVYKNALPNKGLCDDIPHYLQSLQFPVVPIVKKQKNNKARRAARRAAELAAASGEQPTSTDSTQLAEAQGDATAETPKEPEQQEAEPEREAENAEEEEEEEEEEEVYEPDWLKYQKQPKLSQATTVLPTTNQARYWTLILLGGGHFAGVVMDLAGQVSHHGRDMKMVAHKTFHRYTVRRKQGGSQASHGIANSAGARIRMYNEEALKLEVRELLDGWSHWIKQSECVYVHAPGNNRRVLFYDNSVISAAERQGRLRSIPFMTRRPTLSELKRAYQELTTVKVSVLTKEALERMEMEEQEGLEKVLKASMAKSAKEKEVASKKAQQLAEAITIAEASPELAKLVDLVKKGRAEAVSNHLLKHGIDASQLLPLTSSTEYDVRRTPTILHLASHHGQAPVVKILLEKHNADPTMTTASAMNPQEADGEDASQQGASSFTAYDIAKDKETRNAFRRAMALLPDSWDWIGGAHVPSALTPEMEAEQERKAKEKTRKLLDAERERKKTREANRPATTTTAESSASTGSSSSQSVLSKNMAAVSAANSHLSPEMRMRLERERRAAAAEARMAAQQQVESIRRAVQQGQNVCVACGKSLDNLTPFDKFGKKFCTTDCVAKGPA